MLEGEEQGTTPLTLSEAASLFESDDADATVETASSDATPPSQESPETESDEAEAASEQADAEDESPDDEKAEEAEETEEPADELFTLTVDGETVQVTREELLKGYSRQTDYTRKTMKLADERKAVEARDKELAGERERLAAQLSKLEEAVKAQTPAEPDWHDLRTKLEPGEFAAEYAAWQHHKESLKQIEEARKQADEAVQRDRQKALADYVAQQQQMLLEAIPELKDETKGKERRSQWVEAAIAVGFEREDLNMVSDHRLFKLLDKAAKYDALQKAKPVIQQKIEKVKTATPGAKGTTTPRKRSAAEEASRRLAQTGSIHDAADWFLHSEA